MTNTENYKNLYELITDTKRRNIPPGKPLDLYLTEEEQQMIGKVFCWDEDPDDEGDYILYLDTYQGQICAITEYQKDLDLDDWVDDEVIGKLYESINKRLD